MMEMRRVAEMCAMPKAYLRQRVGHDVIAQFGSELPWPPSAVTTNCRLPSEYVMGVDCPPAGNRSCQSCWPVATSKARINSQPCRQEADPPAVVMGPPSIGVPIFNATGIGELSRVVPTGCCQITWLVFRSSPAMVPQGGCMQGNPIGDMKALRVTPNGRAIHRLRAGFLAGFQRGRRRGGIFLAHAGSVLKQTVWNRIGDGDLADRINGDATPLKHPKVAGKYQRALRRWRGERAFIAQPVKGDAASELVEIVAPHIIAPFSLSRGRKLSSEKGCVGDSRSPGAGPCGTGVSGAGTSNLPSRRSSTKMLPVLAGI